MSSTRNTIHKVAVGDTLDSLVTAYRLSSTRAILDTESNASVRSLLLKGGELPVDLVIHIPPNAADILRRRMNRLNELKPVILAHFHSLQELTASELMPALEKDVYPYDSDEVSSVLRNLEEFILRAIDQLIASSVIFVELGSAMSLTHVGTADDRVLATASSYPVVGLSWAISENGLAAWKATWGRDVLDSKWDASSRDATAKLIFDHLMTIRSIVVQSTDRRFRESLLLQQKLQAE